MKPSGTLTFLMAVATSVASLALPSGAHAGANARVAWYPEQWPEAQWEVDLALMERAGIRFVRVGEFVWSTLEPRKGEYELDRLARAIRAAERHHIAVVIGTPPAAPTAWLTS